MRVYTGGRRNPLQGKGIHKVVAPKPRAPRKRPTVYGNAFKDAPRPKNGKVHTSILSTEEIERIFGGK